MGHTAWMDPNSAHENLAQLSSVATSLTDLISQVVAIADERRDQPDDDLCVELDEVERALRSARRKLDRLVHRLR